jgi:hypothetical protein
MRASVLCGHREWNVPKNHRGKHVKTSDATRSGPDTLFECGKQLCYMCTLARPNCEYLWHAPVGADRSEAHVICRLAEMLPRAPAAKGQHELQLAML